MLLFYLFVKYGHGWLGFLSQSDICCHIKSCNCYEVLDYPYVGFQAV